MDFEFDAETKEKSIKKARLPSTLLKRLAKRGLIEKEQAKKLIENAEKSERASKEEIIAENYDEVEEPNQYDFEYVRKPEENLWKERMKKRISEGGYSGYKCCPNKYNIFHKCTLYCVNKWGDGIPEPSDEYLKRKIRLLARYPLPVGWKEVYDIGCGAHYYWNSQDNTVSWLPPSHPKSHISKSAGLLRKELEESIPIDDLDMQPPGVEDVYDNVIIPTAQANPVQEQPIKIHHVQKKIKSRDLDKALRTKSERRQRRDECDKLDPMDPASYSDTCPRGSWSAGLHNEERVAPDSLAIGSLFQTRLVQKKLEIENNKNNSNIESENSDNDDDDDDDDDDD